MSGYKKQKPFGIVFSSANQPGHESRMGAPIRSIMAQNQIVGTQPKQNPETFSADSIFKHSSDLREKFVSMQVPQLLPSRMMGRK